MTSEARIEANKRNASKSTGPKTAEGKAKSAQNATKHGLTASSTPTDPAYQAHLTAWLDDAKPVGAIETTMVERAAHAAWRLKKSAEQEAALLRFKAGRAADLHDQTELDRAVRLGERLIQDPLNRCAVYQEYDPNVIKRVARWREDDPVSLSSELELTIAGVDWKILRWLELGRMLQLEGYWHYDARYKACKLAGLRPEDTMHDAMVEEITLACNALHPEAWDLWDDICQASIGVENRPIYRVRVDEFRKRKPDKQTALAQLWHFFTVEITRLRELRESMVERAQAERLEAEMRISAEDIPAASLRLRYEAASSRQMHAALTELGKLKKARAESEEEPVESEEETVEEVTENLAPPKLPPEPLPNEPNPVPTDEAPQEVSAPVVEDVAAWRRRHRMIQA